MRGYVEVHGLASECLEVLALEKNRAKGGWKSFGLRELLELAKGELAELEEAIAAIEGGDVSFRAHWHVQREAADVANYMAFLRSRAIDDATRQIGIGVIRD